jgi:antitoxin (DNA-binding transcriptional repressor) of toxin-antitoxin stability system
MRDVDIEEARRDLEKLVDEIKPGERFTISVNGIPKVQVVALTPEEFAMLDLTEG